MIIDRGLEGATSVHPADVDGDGENTAFIQREGVFWGQEMFAADVDGDVDVISALAWHENTDGQGTFV